MQSTVTSGNPTFMNEFTSETPGKKGKKKGSAQELEKKKRQKKEDVFIPELSHPDPLQEEEIEIERILMEEDDDVINTPEVPSMRVYIIFYN